MMLRAALLLLLVGCASGQHSASPQTRAGGFRKIVALVPVRDEAHLLPSCLRSLVPYVDATVVLDDCSTDGSAAVAEALARECKVERVARSPNCPQSDGGLGAQPYWGDEASHRGFLMDLGRSVGGTHFLAIDADEAIVAGEGGDAINGWRQTFYGLQPGDVLAMHYMTMWRSTTMYRADKSDFKAVAWVDSPGTSFRRSETDDRLHIRRVPTISRPGRAFEYRAEIDLGAPHTAVLHFGFSNLINARLKNAVYNMFDIITGTQKTKEFMNKGLQEQGLTAEAEELIARNHMKEGPHHWWISLGPTFNHSAFDSVSLWRERKILSWLMSGEGPAKFCGLEALQMLARHSFYTVTPNVGQRISKMLWRLRKCQ